MSLFHVETNLWLVRNWLVSTQKVIDHIDNLSISTLVFSIEIIDKFYFNLVCLIYWVLSISLIWRYVYPTMEDLSEQISDVVLHFNLKSFTGLGVGVGANILVRYALAHPEKVFINFTVKKKLFVLFSLLQEWSNNDNSQDRYREKRKELIVSSKPLKRITFLLL